MPPPSETSPRGDLSSAAGILRNLEQRWLATAGVLPHADGTWRYSRKLQPGDPLQGWKIHLSATPLSAVELLSRVRPLLTAADILFKVPQTMGTLVEMNSGLPRFSQIGKFLTLYPRSNAEALNVAAILRRITLDLRGPEIPFDRRYRRNSIVYYRYGAFGTAEADGSVEGSVRDPMGRRHRDRRAAGCAVPSWLTDPFQRARAARPLTKGPIGLEYLPFRVIAQRGKGGVYEALDLSVSPARRVILKEGRPEGEIDFRGRDGAMRVRHEARVLCALARSGVPVPAVLREFRQGGNRYLVLEKVPGRPLLPRRRLQSTKYSSQRAEKFLDRIEPLLAKVHAAGWVWRDGKPSHIFTHRNAVWLLDFEGACRVDDVEALPWSSPNYIAPEQERNLSRSSGSREDDYALGVMAYQFLAGDFPSSKAKERAAAYRQAKCPGALRIRIEHLLAGEGQSRGERRLAFPRRRRKLLP